MLKRGKSKRAAVPCESRKPRFLLFGCDPGSANAGMCVMRKSGKIIGLAKAPVFTIELGTKNKKTKKNKVRTEMDIQGVFEWISSFIIPGDYLVFVIEDVGPLPPRMGVLATAGLLCSKIAFRSLAIALRAKIIMIPAKRWQEVLHKYKIGKKHDKGVSLRYAKDSWPRWASTINKDHNLAESCIIAKSGLLEHLNQGGVGNV